MNLTALNASCHTTSTWKHEHRKHFSTSLAVLFPACRHVPPCRSCTSPKSAFRGKGSVLGGIVISLASRTLTDVILASDSDTPQALKSDSLSIYPCSFAHMLLPVCTHRAFSSSRTEQAEHPAHARQEAATASSQHSLLGASPAQDLVPILAGLPALRSLWMELGSLQVCVCA